MRALAKFILTKLKRRGKAPGRNEKRTNAGSPPLCGNAQATSIPTVVSDLR